MKVVRMRDKRETLHVETPLGIVNIEVGLTDRKGRRVEAICTIAPRNMGEKKVLLRGRGVTRLVECLEAKNR